MPVLAADRVGLGQAVGVAQRGRGVGVLDDVVLGLGLARVAAEAALPAQPVELPGAAGQHLVHVGLVAGVPHDPVAGRVEDPVDRERQLDHAEVGAEVPADGRAGGDQEVADLGRQGRQLVVGEAAEVARTRDLIEQTHGRRVYGCRTRSRTATAGSCRLPIQTRPSCSRTPVTMW